MLMSVDFFIGFGQVHGEDLHAIILFVGVYDACQTNHRVMMTSASAQNASPASQPLRKPAGLPAHHLSWHGIENDPDHDRTPAKHLRTDAAERPPHHGAERDSEARSRQL